MRQVYLFDLYDTVLKDISFEFQRGMRFLYDCYFSTVCSWEDFSAYEDTFSPLYEQRKVNNTEISLIYDEVLPIFRKFGIVPPADLDELDFQIMDHMQEETLLPSVRQTLEKLYGRGFHMYILSNAIFTAKSARRLLRRFGIDGYFRRVYSSADHGIRKPNPRFFEMAVHEILAENPNTERRDILYIGNDYITDVTGGVLAGLPTVWYNVDQKPDRDGLSVRSISNFCELLEGIE
ncbi:MAG: HAD hydrolase-like protein [Oscillospiraceae bacterium]|nr:HAD hydrolase-like protein [Oscillospiraceae bacterium]